MISTALTTRSSDRRVAPTTARCYRKSVAVGSNSPKIVEGGDDQGGGSPPAGRTARRAAARSKARNTIHSVVKVAAMPIRPGSKPNRAGRPLGDQQQKPGIDEDHEPAQLAGPAAAGEITLDPFRESIGDARRW